MPDVELIDPPALGGASYSQVACAGGLVFLAGQVALDEHGHVVAPGDVGQQTALVFQRIRRLLADAGSDLTHVVSATVYLTDLDDFATFNAVWSETFGDHRPTRATVRADLMIEGLVVEVQAVAARAS